MKILALGDVYSVKEFGGATRHQLGICAALAARNHTVHMLLPCKRHEESDLKAQLPGLEFTLYDANYGTPQHMPMMILNSAKEFRRIAISGGYDIIQLSQPMSGFGPCFSFGKTNARIVYNFQSPWAEEFRIKRDGKKGPFWILRKMMEATILRKCDAIMTLSEYMKKELLREHPYLANKNIRVIAGSVDTERFVPAADRVATRKLVNYPDGKKILFTVRGLKPRTGVGNLIDAMPEIARRHPDVFLVVGGSGPMRAELEEKVAKNSLQNHVRFEGFIPDDLLPSYFQAADVFVLPTLDLEGFGIVTAEALACGTPAVATPVGATPELLQALDPMLLMRDVTPEAMAEKISLWLNDMPKLEGMRDKCRAHALSNFTWDSATQRVEKFYEDIIRRDTR